jgi:pimeloyl-ACP methyl ester carboxylesterase
MTAYETTDLEFERLRDIDVAYIAAGFGRPLVLVHGLAQDHGMWAVQQAHLAEFRTFAYDLRGHGRTSLGDADGSLAQLGQDLIAFLELVGPAVGVGFSLGGTVVLWAAAERPELFEGVVAIATSSVVGRSALTGLQERIALFETGAEAQVREALFTDTLAQLTLGSQQAGAITEQRMRAIGDRRGYVNAARAIATMHEQPLNDRLARIGHSVLIVGGELDEFCPSRAAEVMLEFLPSAVYRELPGVGHLVCDDDPDAVTEALRDYLAGGES